MYNPVGRYYVVHKQLRPVHEIVLREQINQPVNHASHGFAIFTGKDISNMHTHSTPLYALVAKHLV